MLKPERIAIISTRSFGYIDFLAEKLKATENIDLVYINIDSISFSYKNRLSRIRNGFRKLFSLPNMKDINRIEFIKKELADKGTFDTILVIRPDKISKLALMYLRENTSNLVCYLFDGIENFKDQKKILHYFDFVYSYDKKDVLNNNFKFLTNYIYDFKIDTKKISNLAFNVSSYDERFPFLEKLANHFENINLPFRFIVKKEKPFNHDLIEISAVYLSLLEVKDVLAESFAIVDIQKQNQTGLSFRVFEALGYRKKLITNNQDVVNYEFYNPTNIFIITEDNYQIPKFFFDTPYVEIDPQILAKYYIDNWILQVFNIDCNSSLK
ncbi:hypothetical protein [Flavobacterium sp. RS13.1]|uniref:hypothetical protein n=1 Tax=Flavobacterium sp. RS13.1 TaxID=3400345 RepID=UPI003AACA322